MASGDRAARAAICDLLEVTRQVMKPVAENGTHWCAEVAPKQQRRVAFDGEATHPPTGEDVAPAAKQGGVVSSGDEHL